MTKQGGQTDRIRQVLHLLMQLPRLALLASLVYGLVVLDWELAGISVAVLITTYGLFAALKQLRHEPALKSENSYRCYTVNVKF